MVKFLNSTNCKLEDWEGGKSAQRKLQKLLQKVTDVGEDFSRKVSAAQRCLIKNKVHQIAY